MAHLPDQKGRASNVLSRIKAWTHDATLRATFASRSYTQCCRRRTHGETVARDVAEVVADSTSATVARNIAATLSRVDTR